MATNPDFIGSANRKLRGGPETDTLSRTLQCKRLRQLQHRRRKRFCDDVRNATPPQHIMFLVGKPEYLANAPAPGPELPAQEDADPALWSDVKAALAAEGAGTQRWGIMEACRRISAVRSVSEARSRALRNRPAPLRDSEISQSKRIDEPAILAQTILAQTEFDQKIFDQKIMEKAQ